MMEKEHVKPFLWGVAVGAIVLLIVIFSAGWVVTSSSAKAEAKTIAADAVMNRLAPIAVEQFMRDPNKQERLKELKKLDSWGMNNRTDYVQKQGWATMPGEKDSDREIAQEVARRLMELN